MTCLYPIKAYRSRERTATGGYGITFNPHRSLVEGSSFCVPCGKCPGCRVDRSRAWALRCMHEAQLHPENSFVTLTFDDKNLPDDYSVRPSDIQNFFKRLIDANPHKKIRRFTCGEYGEENLRPHYHALIFNHSFSDKILYSKKTNKLNPLQPIKLYTSPTLSKLWPYGHATTGDLTYQSAAYCARYTIKKIGGDLAPLHYERVHPLTGKLCQVLPEFATQSRRPGLGAGWFDLYKSDLYPSDFLTVDGKKHAVPKYYVLKLQEEEQIRIKRRRKALSLKTRADSTPARLKVRETVLLSKLKMLKRNLK
ncbi:replication initiator protein [Blackfly microvirus SF02]|uniref:Replication initiator protein n=1 Tax=Blackfly microvirus SF02 TaxID=2576452 RepID=A0A4P8PSG9_9VIRU|nr:replication initiator protein [Blackfly microvirus SF02]